MRHVKGDRRKPNELEQLRALAASIPDQATLNNFVLRFPRAQRSQVYALIAPLVTQFTPAGAVARTPMFTDEFSLAEERSLDEFFDTGHLRTDGKTESPAAGEAAGPGIL